MMGNRQDNLIFNEEFLINLLEMVRNEEDKSVILSTFVEYEGQLFHQIIAALKNKNWEVRIGAAIVLGEIRKAAAVEPLIGVLFDEEIDVIDAAISALEKIGSDSVHVLIRALEDNDWRIRAGAIVALTKLKVTLAIEPLISRLGDLEDQVRWRAAWALGVFKDKRAIPALLELSKTDMREIQSGDRISDIAQYSINQIEGTNNHS